MPSTLVKISGLLSDHQNQVLEKFLSVHQCTKAKAMGMLLELWEKENYPTIEKEEAVKKSELVTLIDERLTATLTALNLIPNLVTNLNSNNTANSNTNLNNENADNSVNSNNTANLVTNLSNESDSNKDSNIITNLITNSKDKEKEDVTVKSTLSESLIMPLSEDLGIIATNEDLTANNSDIQLVDAETLVLKDVEKAINNDLTEAQQKVMENLNKIPAGERLSYNKLADKLGVSRTVLDSFELWQQEFTIEPKKRGCDYIKK
jgi:hypothetical protein